MLLPRLDSQRPLLGRGDDTVGNPHRARICNSSCSNSTVSVRLVRAYPLTEIRQSVPCRAMRGESNLSQQYPSPVFFFFAPAPDVQTPSIRPISVQY